MDNPQRKLVILYGSQTGTAQDVAEKLGRVAKRHHFNALVTTLDDYNVVRVSYFNANTVVWIMIL